VAADSIRAKAATAAASKRADRTSRTLVVKEWCCPHPGLTRDVEKMSPVGLDVFYSLILGLWSLVLSGRKRPPTAAQRPKT
jgi:hypothetical protein